VWGADEDPASPPQGPEALTHVKRGLRRPLAVAGILSLAMNLLALTTPIYMSQVYDRVLSAYSAETLAMLTLMALGLLLLFVLIDNARGQLWTVAALKAEEDLGEALLAASVKDQLAGRPDASQPLRDLAALRGFATSPAMTAVFDAPMVPLY